MKTLSIEACSSMALLVLIGATVAVTGVHAEDSIAGHRLFFTEAQRLDATRKLPDVLSESLLDTSVLEPAATRKDRTSGTRERASADTVDRLNAWQGRASGPRRDSLRNNYQVYFTGLVTGMREVRILVNGLPCEPATAEHNARTDQLLPITCHGVRNEGLILAVSVASVELLVTDSAGRVHYLLPGEGM